MKKILVCLLALLLSLCLVACDKENSDTSNPDKEALDIDAYVSAIIEEYKIEGGTLYFSSSDNEFDRFDEDIIRNMYGDIASVPDFSTVEQYSVFVGSNPVAPCEFGIFKMSKDADIEQFKLYLQARIDAKVENARHYPEIDSEALTTAKLESKNGFVWYLMVKGGNDKINDELKEKI